MQARTGRPSLADEGIGLPIEPVCFRAGAKKQIVRGQLTLIVK